MAICELCTQEMTAESWCPSCRRQPITRDRPGDELPDEGWDDEDDDGDRLDEALPAGLVPFGAAVAPLRARHHAALRDVAAWSLAHGRPCALDVAALCLDALDEHRTPDGLRLDRPSVNGVLTTAIPNRSSMLRTLVPSGVPAVLWNVLSWLTTDSRLHPASDPFPALLEPLRCYGGLGADGLPATDGNALDFPCQCFLPYDPTCPPGLADRLVGVDFDAGRVWLVRGRMQPRGAPTAPADRAPLHAWGVRVREVEVGGFSYVGCAESSRQAPRLWLYTYDPAGRGRHDHLHLDEVGRAYMPRADRRYAAGFRWVPIRDTLGAIRAGVGSEAATS